MFHEELTVELIVKQAFILKDWKIVHFTNSATNSENVNRLIA